MQLVHCMECGVGRCMNTCVPQKGCGVYFLRMCSPGDTEMSSQNLTGSFIALKIACVFVPATFDWGVLTGTVSSDTLTVVAVMVLSRSYVRHCGCFFCVSVLFNKESAQTCTAYSVILMLKCDRSQHVQINTINLR